MKYDCGETWDEKLVRLGKFHKWFAWYPVYLGPHNCRWLETVMRRKTHIDYRPPHRSWNVEYRAVATYES